MICEIMLAFLTFVFRLLPRFLRMNHVRTSDPKTDKNAVRSPNGFRVSMSSVFKVPLGKGREGSTES